MKYFFIAITTITICATLVYFSVIERFQPVPTNDIRARFFIPKEKEVVIKRDWSQINDEIRKAVSIAHDKALNQAREELDVWHAKKMKLLDRSFLPWYFNYFNQLGLGFKAMGYGVVNWWNSSDSSALDQIANEILKELESRVLHKHLIQGQMEDIAKHSVYVFVNELSQILDTLPKKFSVPEVDWDQHINKIALMTTDTNGFTSQSITLKVLTGGAVLGAKTLAFPVTKLLIPTIRSTVAAGVKATSFRSAVKYTIKKNIKGIALNQASKNATKATASGPLGVTIVGGLLAWEAWDHSATVASNQPVLRNQIDESLRQVESNLLEPDGVIGSVLDKIEGSIYEGLTKSDKSAS